MQAISANFFFLQKEKTKGGEGEPKSAAVGG
jgi:hypothetical protein